MLRRRRFWLVLSALIFSTVWWEIDQAKREKLQSSSSTSEMGLVVSHPLPTSSHPNLDVAPRSLTVDPEVYAELNSPASDPLNDLKIVNQLLANALTLEHASPAPSLERNEEVTRILIGVNPDRHVFLPANHPAIDRKGQLCDRWATPYFFHLLSETQVEIHSAGPDRKFFTRDDLQWPAPSKVGQETR